MAFPNDLDNVDYFKIHPALGVARLANNDKYYEFFAYKEERDAGRGADLEYMSVQDGQHRVMRQAVQYKIFAYAADDSEVGELTKEVMSDLSIKATWSASIANRKLNNFSGGSTPAVTAEGSASDGATVRLLGDNPWHNSKVWLGDLTGDGLFIPPKGGVYRENDQREIKAYGDHRRDNGVLDTTSDGAIGVQITGAGGKEVIPASVIVAPQQHSPDVDPADIDSGKNLNFVRETRELLGISTNATLNGKGYEMDVAIMRSINAEYNPGMEVCLNNGFWVAGLGVSDPADIFYPRGTDGIDENEIRPRYENGHANHGALTAGLCSVWQTDLNACLDYWTAEFPDRLRFSDAPTRRSLSRKLYAEDGDRMDNNEDLNAYIDMMGVARNTTGSINRLFETERDDNDNAGATPTKPFDLEPEDSIS